MPIVDAALLRAVRQRIEDGHNTYICCATDEEATGRLGAMSEERQEVARMLRSEGICVSGFGFGRGIEARVKRLAWLDRHIARLEAEGAA